MEFAYNKYRLGPGTVIVIFYLYFKNIYFFFFIMKLYLVLQVTYD